MIYCRVIDGEILEGPRALPIDIPVESTTEYDWYPTIFLNMPHHIESECNPVTQIIRMKMNFIGDKVECFHVVENKSEEDIQSTQELLLKFLRNQRDEKLLKSDWTQLPNSILTTEKKVEWETYRQALRDFPSTVQLDSVVWPIQPQ